MAEKKRDIVTFFAGLLIGLLILVIYFFISSLWNAADSEGTDSDRGGGTEYADIHLSDWEKVDVKSALPFIKEKKIQIIAFVDEKGGFFFADKAGNRIEGWCLRDGTKIGKACSNLHAREFLYANHLTFIITKGSPMQMNIINGGYSVCIDPNTGMPCQ